MIVRLKTDRSRIAQQRIGQQAVVAQIKTGQEWSTGLRFLKNKCSVKNHTRLKLSLPEQANNVE